MNLKNLTIFQVLVYILYINVLRLTVKGIRDTTFILPSIFYADKEITRIMKKLGNKLKISDGLEKGVVEFINSLTENLADKELLQLCMKRNLFVISTVR